MEAHIRANRLHWDELVPIHEKSTYYDVKAFRAGESTLHSIELQELGDVSGKSLLHLQCHFGLDTLSWARMGGIVTGVDFSEKAIALARSLSNELKTEADFVCSNLYDLPGVLTGEFDIVFTSYGVLCWLPDLKGWAEVIAYFLKPGGTFYIVEDHPFANIFDDSKGVTELRAVRPYFHSREPEKWDAEGSYAEPGVKLIHSVHYEWAHSISDILNALTTAGLDVAFLHEFPFCAWPRFPFLTQGEDGWWRLERHSESVPLMFSIKAFKPL
jgi:SAM-dependent methyltransferase